MFRYILMRENGLTIGLILENYIQEAVKRETIITLVKLLSDYEYAVVGGFAVSFYYKGARPVTPDDVDVKVLEADLEDVIQALESHGFRYLRKNVFMDSVWHILEKDGQGVDLGVARKRWDVEGIKRARKVVYKGVEFRIMPPEYLLVSKLYAGRPKDLLDVAYLIKGGSVRPETALSFVKKYLPAEEEDFRVLLDYIERFDFGNLSKIFGVS